MQHEMQLLFQYSVACPFPDVQYIHRGPWIMQHNYLEGEIEKPDIRKSGGGARKGFCLDYRTATGV